MSTNTENLVKICHVLSEIFGEICPFCRVVQKLTDVTLVICAITGPIFVKFAQNVAKILRLNIFELECQVYHSNPFRSDSLPNEGQFANFAQN